MRTVTVTLTAEDLALLSEALDSHAYWQCSDIEFRRDGYVQEPGSHDPDNAAEIAHCEELQGRLAALAPESGPDGAA